MIVMMMMVVRMKWLVGYDDGYDYNDHHYDYNDHDDA
jgi:hypothetical protein